MEKKEQTETARERPPLGSWPRFYTLVLGFLLFQIILYYIISISF